MSALGTLKLTTAKRTAQISPVIQRRNKLIRRIGEQIELAKAKQQGTQYAPTKQVKVIDDETGEKKLVQVPKRVKDWSFTAENGKVCVTLRYGATIIELAKGKTAVELANENELVTTLETLSKAVENGELDAQLEATSGTVKAGFKK